MENRWLRNLVTEKTGKDDVGELWRKFSAENLSGGGGRAGRERVGTGTKVGAEREGEEGEEGEREEREERADGVLI